MYKICVQIEKSLKKVEGKERDAITENFPKKTRGEIETTIFWCDDNKLRIVFVSFLSRSVWPSPGLKCL